MQFIEPKTIDEYVLAMPAARSCANCVSSWIAGRRGILILVGPPGSGKWPLIRAACASSGVACRTVRKSDKGTKKLLSSLAETRKTRTVSQYCRAVSSLSSSSPLTSTHVVPAVDSDFAKTDTLPKCVSIVRAASIPTVFVLTDAAWKEIACYHCPSLARAKDVTVARLFRPTVQALSRILSEMTPSSSFKEKKLLSVLPSSPRYSLCEAISKECGCDIRRSIIELHLATSCQNKKGQMAEPPESYYCQDALTTTITTNTTTFTATDVAQRLLTQSGSVTLQTILDRCESYSMYNISEILSEHYVQFPNLTAINDVALLAEHISNYDRGLKTSCDCIVPYSNNDILCATAVSRLMVSINNKREKKRMKQQQQQQRPTSWPPVTRYRQSYKDMFGRMPSRYCTFTEFCIYYLPALRTKFFTSIVDVLSIRLPPPTAGVIDRISDCVASELAMQYGFTCDDWEELFVGKNLANRPNASSSCSMPIVRDFVTKVSTKMRNILAMSTMTKKRR